MVNRLESMTCSEGGADSGKNRLKAKRAWIIRFPDGWEVLGSASGIGAPEAEDQRTGQQDQEQAEEVVGCHHGDLDAERQADQAHLGEAARRIAQHCGVEVEA